MALTNEADQLRPWTPRSNASTTIPDPTRGTPDDSLIVQMLQSRWAQLGDDDASPPAAEDNVGPSDRKAFRKLLRRSKLYFDDYPRDVVLQQALEVGMIRSRDATDADVLWFEAEPPGWEMMDSLKDGQRINSFLGMKLLATKCEFARAINTAKQLLRDSSQEDVFQFVPQTWVLPQDRPSLPNVANASKMFIVKPDGGCGGDGIYLTTDISNIRHSECVIQEYISKPLLLGGVKFDMRVYVLVTSLVPELRFHVHREGLFRMAVEPYDPSPSLMYKLNMHLTNYSLNKFSTNFVPNVDARDDRASSKRSITTGFAQLQEEYGNAFDSEGVWEKITDLVDVTLTTLLPFLQVAVKGRTHFLSKCFQIMGFDVLLDKEFNCHLLEVNHHPSLLTDAPIDWLVKGSLLKYTLRIVSHDAALRSARRREARVNKRAQGGEKSAATSGPVNDNDEDEDVIAVPAERKEWEDAVAGDLFTTRSSRMQRTPLFLNFVEPVNTLREIFVAHADDARSNKKQSTCVMNGLKFSKFCRRCGLIGPAFLSSSAECDLMYIRTPKSRGDGLTFADFLQLCLNDLGNALAPSTASGSAQRLLEVCNVLEC